MHDALRQDNSNRHTAMLGDAKFKLGSWRLGKISEFPYTTFLIVPADGTKSQTLAAIENIRRHYSNSHIFVPFETTTWLDTHGPLAFVRKISISQLPDQLAHIFDVIVQVSETGTIIVSPSDQRSSPFVRQMLEGSND